MGTARRLPVVFLPHGGGPWPFVDLGLGDSPTGFASLERHLRSVPQLTTTPPRALLVISAHWEEEIPTVTTGTSPGLLYDYYGFPPESYELTWPAPGSPALAARVRSLLEGAGFTTAGDPSRGFDHGTFVPLKLAYPDAAIPTVQLSLVRGLDPAQHLALGRALQPLRDEGIFVVGSGMTFHDLRTFFSPRALAPSEAFDAWLREAATMAPPERDARLVGWESAPAARQAHPREEHLLPLMVVAGAAGGDRGHVAWNDVYLNARLSSFEFR